MARKTPGEPAPQLGCPGCHAAFSVAAVLVTLGARRWQVKGKG